MKIVEISKGDELQEMLRDELESSMQTEVYLDCINLATFSYISGTRCFHG